LGSRPQLTQTEPLLRTAQLRELVESAVERSTADGILLSGGLDTSILTAVAAKQSRRLRAVSVAVAGAPAPDEPFVKTMAERCECPLLILRPSLGDLIAAMPAVMRVLGGFDPMELRNSAVTWLALREAREQGIAAVLTGDAADELFAGYSYITRMPAEQLRPYLDFLNRVMRFSSQPMGASLGVQAQIPYLDPAVRAFALQMSRDDLVFERDGQRFGKKVLREAFVGLLPPEITWRIKTPLEFGSGSHALQTFVTESLSNDEFESARIRLAAEDGISLRDKEQFFYYRIYRTIFPPPREQMGGAKRCSACRGAIERAEQNYCRVCGAYPC
jgi:asparagine synthase (glutamine-hydrolysing)